MYTYIKAAQNPTELNCEHISQYLLVQKAKIQQSKSHISYLPSVEIENPAPMVNHAWQTAFNCIGRIRDAHYELLKDEWVADGDRLEELLCPFWISRVQHVMQTVETAGNKLHPSLLPGFGDFVM